ncbi:MAG: AAA family ATPase, partial [Clostridia bacterium]|nr:AAA family ATPase [Clostridia bacterium]
RAGSSNPVMMLDELDKMTRDAHGDPGAALLEVLDAEQNKFFRDHFMEVPFDLSDTVFIATANTLDTVPRPLIDRMEIIEMHSYTKTEKIRIARNHLIPKQMSRHGLSELEFSIRDDTLETIIDEYTHEAGVRNLERQLATLIRKIVTRLEKKEIHPPVEVSPDDLTGYLGPNKNLKTHISEQDEIGVVNGLAYTETGGELLKVEAAVLDGTGKIELTGSLGDVMKESARLAVSYVRSIAKDYDIDPDFYKNKDIHIHFPEGATPKDGPSAGVTMVTALISALTNRPVRRDIAMTGEITLRGNVLPIGGLREKTMGAYTAGVKTVFLPQANRPDLAEIDKEAGSHLDFVPVSTVGQILDSALVAKA